MIGRKSNLYQSQSHLISHVPSLLSPSAKVREKVTKNMADPADPKFMTGIDLFDISSILLPGQGECGEGRTE